MGVQFVTTFSFITFVLIQLEEGLYVYQIALQLHLSYYPHSVDPNTRNSCIIHKSYFRSNNGYLLFVRCNFALSSNTVYQFPIKVYTKNWMNYDECQIKVYNVQVYQHIPHMFIHITICLCFHLCI